jgi:hypothetical protein
MFKSGAISYLLKGISYIVNPLAIKKMAVFVYKFSGFVPNALFATHTQSSLVEQSLAISINYYFTIHSALPIADIHLAWGVIRRPIKHNYLFILRHLLKFFYQL